MLLLLVDDDFSLRMDVRARVRPRGRVGVFATFYTAYDRTESKAVELRILYYHEDTQATSQSFHFTPTNNVLHLEFFLISTGLACHLRQLASLYVPA